MNPFNHIQTHIWPNENQNNSPKQSFQVSPQSDQVIADQNSMNQLNSSSSRKHLSTNRHLEQHEIDDFFENFNQNLQIKYGNQNPIKSKYLYNCKLIEIFESIRKQDSEQKRMIQNMGINKSSSRIADKERQESKMPSPNSQKEINKNNVYQQLKTESHDNYGQNDTSNQPQLKLQSIRRIRTQSCDIDESVAQFNLQQLVQLQQQNQQKISLQNKNNKVVSALNKNIKKINIEDQYPNLIQEKIIPLQQNNLYDPIQQQQNISNYNSYYPTPHIPAKNIYESLNVNPLFGAQKGKKRSLSINCNQPNLNQFENIENNNIQQLKENSNNNNQINKENVDPNGIIQNCNKEFEDTHEYLKKRIQNIQANVKISKDDFMKRIYSSINQNQQAFQAKTQNNEGPQQIQTKFENFNINQNTTKNPISQLSNNYIAINSYQNRQQQQTNNQNDEVNNRNHLNNKFKTFVTRKSIVERTGNQQSQQQNQNCNINHPFAEQLRERVTKQWDMNKENILIPQQILINNKNVQKQLILQSNLQQQQIKMNQKHKNTQAQYNNLQYQSNNIQQQQFSYNNDQQPQNQLQFKSIKRIY